MHMNPHMSDYAQLRRRAEQCRAEEMARLVALARAALRGWRARVSAHRATPTRPGATPRAC